MAIMSGGNCVMTSRPGKGAGSGAAGSGAQAPPLDDVDRAIVAVLREDGRISMRALGARLHISRSGACLRVQRLEEAGVITGYSAWVDPQRYGYGLSAARPLRCCRLPLRQAHWSRDR